MSKGALKSIFNISKWSSTFVKDHFQILKMLFYHKKKPKDASTHTLKKLFHTTETTTKKKTGTQAAWSVMFVVTKKTYEHYYCSMSGNVLRSDWTKWENIWLLKGSEINNLTKLMEWWNSKHKE